MNELAMLVGYSVMTWWALHGIEFLIKAIKLYAEYRKSKHGDCEKRTIY